jgi:hypothetical protein
MGKKAFQMKVATLSPQRAMEKPLRIGQGKLEKRFAWRYDAR